MDKKYTLKLLKVFLVIISLLFSVECEQRKKKEEQIYFRVKSNISKKWDDIFPEHELINPSFPPAYYFLTMNSQENYFLYTRKDEKIVQFNKNWNFVREIARKGEGPGEFQIPWPVFCDSKDNLYIHDIGRRLINIFSSPDYRFNRQIKLKSHVSKIIRELESNFITFSLYNTPYLLKKYSEDGRLLKETFKCKDETLRIFMARFNPGGLAEIKNKGFLFIYPDRYIVYLYDYNLNLQKIYLPENFTNFFPSAPDFPSELSPYEISSEHLKWWEQFLHPGDIWIMKDKYFIISMLKSEGVGGKFYINFHDLKGITYAMGIEVPFNGKIVYAREEFLYVLEEERFGKKDEILPARLHRYKLKNSF